MCATTLWMATHPLDFSQVTHVLPANFSIVNDQSFGSLVFVIVYEYQVPTADSTFSDHNCSANSCTADSATGTRVEETYRVLCYYTKTPFYGI